VKPSLSTVRWGAPTVNHGSVLDGQGVARLPDTEEYLDDEVAIELWHPTLLIDEFDSHSQEEAQVQLRQRVEVAIDDFNLMFGDMEMDEVREEALVNMLFNLGRTKLTKFRKMVGAVRKKDWGNAAYEAFNSLWFRQLRKKGLTSIERSERIVWELLTGEKG